MGSDDAPAGPNVVVLAQRELARGVGSPVGRRRCLREPVQEQLAAQSTSLGVARSLAHLPHSPELKQPLLFLSDFVDLFFVLPELVFARSASILGVDLQVLSSSMLHSQITVFLGQELALKCVGNLSSIL